MVVDAPEFYTSAVSHSYRSLLLCMPLILFVSSQTFSLSGTPPQAPMTKYRKGQPASVARAHPHQRRMEMWDTRYLNGFFMQYDESSGSYQPFGRRCRPVRIPLNRDVNGFV